MTALREDAVDRLEQLFGEAEDPANPVGAAALVAADERGEAAEPAEELLRAFGLGAHLVPAALGGRFTSVPDQISVLRAVYRRDPSLGLGTAAGSLMAAANVWTAGNDAQRRRVALRLLSGGRVACGYHELAHGNDLSRAELSALPGPDGRLLLNGRKQVVANLDRAESMVLFARTDRAAGPRGHSQLLVDAAELVPGSYRRLSRFETSGMRGVQLGGVEFSDSPVSPASVVGRPGQGVETALRSFQLTRIALPGMTIGLLDTALRVSLRGAHGRRLYGAAAADLPLARSILAESFADLLLADLFTTVAARSLHTAAAQSGVYASAVKALVPRILMRAVYRLSELLGSQFYLRRGERPLFQKLLRDVQPSGFGHASRAACLSALLPQLPSAARRSWLQPAADELPAETFQPGRPLPPLRFEALAVSANGRDPLVRSLLNTVAGGCPGDARIEAAARFWRAELEDLAAVAGSLRLDQLGPAAQARVFGLAQRWTGVLAAAACVNSWRHRAVDTDGFAAGPLAAAAALHRLGAHFDAHRDPLPAELAEPLYAELDRRFEAGLTFDLSCRPTGA